jgi:serine protease Do
LQVIKGGVLVQDVAKGAAKNAGIQPGDVILRIGTNVIRDVADFEKIAKTLPAGKSVAALIQRRGSPAFLALKIDK